MGETSLAETTNTLYEVRIMAKTTKITKRERYESLLKIPAVAADEGLVEFINHEIDLLNRKTGGEKKPTATQVANEGVKSDILDGMENDRLYSIGEMQKEIPCCADLSNQKISALLRQMILDGKVVKVEDKRKAYFRKV